MSALKVIQVPAAFNTAGLNIVWILVGLIAIYAGIKTFWMKKIRPESEQPFSGVRSVLLQHWHLASGQGFRCPLLLLCVCLPIFKKVKVGKQTHRKKHTPKHSLRRLE